jgi:hypothetical protein
MMNRIRNGFTRTIDGYLRHHFTNLRLAPGSQALLRSAADSAAPVLVVLNHSSWWDPLTCIVIARTLPPRNHRAPMRAEQLRKFPFFRWVGFFPVEPARPRAFLRHVEHAFSTPRPMLWITPQGRFVDVRRHPRLLPGADLVRRRFPATRTLSLALEYLFWNERRPEICARVQEVPPEESLGLAMMANSHSLADLSAERDPARFDNLWPERRRSWCSL